MRSCQVLPGFLFILRLLLLPRALTLQALQLLFDFAILTGVVYGVAIRVRIVGFQSYINSYLLPCRLMHDGTLCLDPKLHIIAISPMYDAYSLDLIKRECRNLLLRVAYQPQTSNITPIGEGDVLPVRFQLPTCCF